MVTIMTREHPQWGLFANILIAALDFEELSGIFRCDGTFRRSVATLLFMTELDLVKDIDIDGTLQYFKENNGYCDCEVIFNIDWYDEERKPLRHRYNMKEEDRAEQWWREKYGNDSDA